MKKVWMVLGMGAAVMGLMIGQINEAAASRVERRPAPTHVAPPWQGPRVKRTPPPGGIPQPPCPPRWCMRERPGR